MNANNVNNANTRVKTAQSVSSKCCLNCFSMMPIAKKHCPLCGKALKIRKSNSLSVSIAYSIAAIIFFIPANFLPTMDSSQLFIYQEDTIISGVFFLWRSGDFEIAIIVFLASFIMPIFKVISITYLCFTCYKKSNKHIVFRTKLYHFNEIIGKWSMIDVFVVALLGAMVKMEAIASMEPRVGILAFAMVVFCSIRSFQCFDPRLIWNGVATSDAQRH